MDCHGLRPRNDPLRVKSTGTSGAASVIARSEATRRSMQAGRQSRIASLNPSAIRNLRCLRTPQTLSRQVLLQIAVKRQRVCRFDFALTL